MKALMITIIGGHFIGILIPLFFMQDIAIQGANFGQKILTVILAIAFIAFMEYQLYTSQRYGTIYCKGLVTSDRPFTFRVSQLGYSILCGFFVVILVQNLIYFLLG